MTVLRSSADDLSCESFSRLELLNSGLIESIGKLEALYEDQIKLNQAIVDKMKLLIADQKKDVNEM